MATEDRGFASMSEEERSKIAAKGGSASGGNFKNDPERAAEAGAKGGKSSHSGGSGKDSESETMDDLDDSEEM